MDKSQSVTFSRVSLGRFAEQLSSTVENALSIGPLHCLRSHKFLCLLSCLTKPTFYCGQCWTNFSKTMILNCSSIYCLSTYLYVQIQATVLEKHRVKHHFKHSSIVRWNWNAPVNIELKAACFLEIAIPSWCGLNSIYLLIFVIY